MTPGVIVIGAGIIGTACALELQLRGQQVLLIDPAPPCDAASRVNAGVISESSVLPVAGPGLWKALPRYLRNLDPALRLHRGDLLRLAPWGLRFLARATTSGVEDTARALAPLTAAAWPAHARLTALSGAGDLVRQTGWTKLYRSPPGAAQALEERLMRELGIPFERLSPGDIHALEPDLAPLYQAGLHYPSARSVASPREVGLRYLAQFQALGGELRHLSAKALHRGADGWHLQTEAGEVTAPRLILAAGAESAALLRPLGLRLPMVAERGYSVHLPPDGRRLSRPVYDAARGFVMTPQLEGIRVSTGVELALPGRAPDPSQIGPALSEARRVLGISAGGGEWRMGMRPSLPDGLPAIGSPKGLAGLWVATGHAHIGFSTSAITAELIADDMAGRRTRVALARFAPDRF